MARAGAHRHSHLWRSDGSEETTLKGFTTESGGLTVVLVDEAMGVDIPVERARAPSRNSLHLDVEKMSKSKKNVVSPDALVAAYGADIVRATDGRLALGTGRSLG